MSIINTFNSISGEGVPLLGPKLTIPYVFQVELDSAYDKVTAVLSLKSPGGEELIQRGESELERKVTTKEQTVGGVYRLESPVFPEFGEYKLSLRVNGKLTASRSLTITKVKPSHDT